MNVLEQLSSGSAEDLREEIRSQADRSLYYFSKVVLGYNELVDHLHLPLAQHLQETEGKRKRGYLYPRGHFKSTIVSKSYPLWRLARNPNLPILIVGESGPVAAKNLRDIKWNITNNEMFQWLYPELLPADTGKTKWTDTEILLPRSKSFDESSITTIGVGAKHTGFHYGLIIYDDMIGLDAAGSRAEMESAIDWFKLAPGLLQDPEVSEEAIIGTRWLYGDQDLYGWEMQHMAEFEWLVRSAIEDEKPLFPERFTLDTLERIRKREGDYKFSCQYLNKPIPQGSMQLSTENLQMYRVSEDMSAIEIGQAEVIH